VLGFGFWFHGWLSYGGVGVEGSGWIGGGGL